MKICICYSKKFFSEIKNFINKQNKIKNKILIPELDFGEVVDIKTRKELANRHHKKIKESDGIYIYNPDGLITRGTNLEMGFALALNKRIFALEEVDDLGIDCFIEKKLTLEQLINLIS